MKLSELRPCDVCGGPIGMLFYRVSVDQVMIDAGATNQVLGLNALLGGQALRLAEVFAPNDDVTMNLQTNTSIVCGNCAYSIPLIQVLFGTEDEDEEE